MSNDLSLSVPTPCSESWDEMSPRPQGRFCGSCNKTVVDFATMTDQQVLDWLSGHTGSVCGRFHPRQLNRPLTAQPLKKPTRYWHYFVALLLSSTELTAQSQPAQPVNTQQLPFGRENRHLLGDTVMVPGLTSPPAVLRSRVVDDKGIPVSGATIMYKEHKGVSADGEGNFSIPAVYLIGVRTLTISAVGYEPLKVDVDKLDMSAAMQPLLVMNMEPMMVGEVVSVVRHRRSRKKAVADTLAKIKDTIISCISPIKNNFTVYPNPVARGNSITITAQVDKPGTYIVQLFDLSGTLLQSTTAAREQLSGAMQLTLPGKLSPGTYIVRLSHPGMNKPYTQQIIVL